MYNALSGVYNTLSGVYSILSGVHKTLLECERQDHPSRGGGDAQDAVVEGAALECSIHCVECATHCPK